MPAANSYSSPSTAGGNREYLRDVLTVLEPEGTPVTSMITKGPEMEGTFAEVLADTYRPARTSGRPEGQDAGVASNNSNKRRRFGNYPHIIREDFGVTDMQMGVEIAGVPSEYDYQKSKAVAQLKRDMEAVICGNQEMQQGASDTEWKTRGLYKWAQSSGSGYGVNAVPDDFLTPTGSILTSVTVSNGIASLTENQLLVVLQSMFTVYGKPMTYQFVGDVTLQAAVDNFSRLQPSSTNQRYYIVDDAKEHEVNFSVTSFNTSFGIVHMIPSMFVNIDSTTGLSTQPSGLILNMAMLELQFFKEGKLHTEDLPRNAGGKNGYAKCVFAVCNKNPKGMGKITA